MIISRQFLIQIITGRVLTDILLSWVDKRFFGFYLLIKLILRIYIFGLLIILGIYLGTFLQQIQHKLRLHILPVIISEE